MCKYCDSIPITIASCRYYDITIDFNNDGKTILRSCGSDAECIINYCPFCGRNLEKQFSKIKENREI